LGDVDVFVVPNPLVRAAGWDLGNASSIRIVNVTESSRAQIYTLAGDLVREIENVQFDGVERGNIEWDTRNADGEPVASGVYIYRVIDDKGGEVMGRLTIVR
jgi:flagellar hook assembly protein FlgD